jgi:hypothetical protein
MDAREIARIGAGGFAAMIKPFSRPPTSDAVVVGFDTEYDSKTRELLSLQLWSGTSGLYVPWPKATRLTPALLMKYVKDVAGDAESYLLVSYFSLAELQFLRINEAFEVREYANGSLDVAFAADDSSMTVYDLARFFERRNLESVAEAFGYRKLKWDTRHVTRRDLSRPGFRDYAMNDAKITFQIFQDLRETFYRHGVDIAYYRTPAGASAAVFRARYVTEDIYCDNASARKTAMVCCWGGRAEAFYRGRLPDVVECDIRAAYPSSAIAIDEFPVAGSWRRADTLSKIDRVKHGFVTVEFDAKGDRFPCLPVFVCDSLVYPSRGVSSCTVEEVREAIARRYALRVLDGWGYSRGTTIVRDYMAWTLDERKTAKGAAAYLYKLLGNSLTGKFWQRTDKVALDDLFKVAEREGIPFDIFLAMRPEEQAAFGVKRTCSVGSVFMPEWAGLVTGFTRARLARMISAGALYAHTDSVWLRARDLPRLRKVDTFPLTWEVKGRGRAVIVRTRFGEIEGDGFSHVPHHSIWNRTAAENALARFRGSAYSFRYPVRRPLKLRESAKRKEAVGTWVTEWRTGNTAWCCKRRLMKGGETEPWRTADEFAEAKRAAKAVDVPAWIQTGEGDNE